MQFLIEQLQTLSSVRVIDEAQMNELLGEAGLTLADLDNRPTAEAVMAALDASLTADPNDRKTFDWDWLESTETVDGTTLTVRPTIGTGRR